MSMSSSQAAHVINARQRQQLVHPAQPTSSVHHHQQCAVSHHVPAAAAAGLHGSRCPVT